MEAVKADGPRRLDSSPTMRLLLKPHATMLTGHFSTLSSDLRFQEDSIGQETAVMVYFNGAGPNPLLIKFRDDKLVWSTEPLSAVKGYNYLPVLSSDGKKALAVAWYGTDPRGIRLRCIGSEGNLLWETQVSSEKMDPWSINLMFWKNHGWLVEYSNVESGKLHLFDFQGKALWATNGVSFYNKSNGESRTSIIQDSRNSIFVLWYDNNSHGNEFRCQRFDASRRALWSEPVTIGPAPQFVLVRPRQIALTLSHQGEICARLYKGIAGDAVYRVTEYSVRISPDGKFQETSKE